MRPLRYLFPLLAWISTGLAQDGKELASAISKLPNCALDCLIPAITESTCELTNATCICTNQKILHDVEVCVLGSCTLRQALVTKNLTSTACHFPVRVNSESTRIANLVLSVLTAFLALARIIYKAAFSLGEFGWDDYTVLAALITGVPSVIIIDRGTIPNGLGRDVWTVPFDHITNFVRWLYALEILYFIQIALLKLTLLFFFLRIFPKITIRRLLWATVVFNVLWGTAFTITAVFQCKPVSLYWTGWDKEHPGKCIDINALAWSNAGISIALDIWMLAIPLHEIFQLQLSWRKKISVAIMFGVGTFVTVMSILRLRSLVHFATSNNPTWDQTDVIQWSNIEINVGIICACLPSMRVILVRCFPRVFGTTRGTSEAYAAYGSRSGAPSGVRNTQKQSVLSHRSANTIGSIQYTKTFEVRHGAAESDETSLVHLDEFDGEGRMKAKTQSSATSISSL